GRTAGTISPGAVSRTHAVNAASSVTVALVRPLSTRTHPTRRTCPPTRTRISLRSPGPITSSGSPPSSVVRRRRAAAPAAEMALPRTAATRAVRRSSRGGIRTPQLRPARVDRVPQRLRRIRGQRPGPEPLRRLRLHLRHGGEVGPRETGRGLPRPLHGRRCLLLRGRRDLDLFGVLFRFGRPRARVLR